MTEILLPDSADPTIAFSISFRAGSQDDPLGKEGLAALTGSMLAEAATLSHSYDGILEALYPLAASYDLTVDKEQSTLTGRVHRERLSDYLPLIISAFTEPAFKTEDLDRLRADAVNYVSNTLRYSSDEELAKAVLWSTVFNGSRFAHLTEGTVAGLENIGNADIRDFYAAHYTQGNVTLGLTGAFDDSVTDALRGAIASLPPGQTAEPPIVTAAPQTAHRLVLVEKAGADASISLGFPIDAHRGEKDFYALWIANSWLGEHRNSASHLFQVIRERRGLNYGDYSYIECFPDGGSLQMPPANVARRQQLFEIWVRTVPVDRAAFALKAALREFDKLVEHGMDAASFDLTRRFLKKYSAHFAPAPAERLGYAVDDHFYAFSDPSLPDEGHLKRFQRMMDELTLADVNAAIDRHWRSQFFTIAIVSGDSGRLASELNSGQATPITYESEMPETLLMEDVEIAAFDADIRSSNTQTVSVDSVFSA